MEIRKYSKNDIKTMVEIWNEVVEEGIAFPQEECLDVESGKDFFASQSYCGIIEEQGCIKGLYILHPNNVGRCGHIANASFAIRSNYRGQHLGEKLVLDCLEQAKKLNFKILQFNAVVKSNIHARHLYERLGFQKLGMVPNGFHLKDGTYEDICLYYHRV